MLFRSPMPDVAIPREPLPEVILRGMERWGDAVAIVDAPTGRTLTYREVVSSIRRMAAGLHKRGLRKGDVFALLLPNCPEYPIAFHGAALAGGILTTCSPLYTADELAFQLEDSGAKYLLTAPMFAEKAIEAARRAHVREVFVLGDARGTTSFATLLDNDGKFPPVSFDVRSDLVALPYSSGTTGLAKGVMLTHHNVVANLHQFQSFEPLGPKDTIIGVLPFFHVYGMVVILNLALLKGARIVTLPRFDMEPFLKAMQEYRVTRAHLVPPIILALAKHPLVSRYNLSSLKMILCSAAPLSAELEAACVARLKCRIKQGYGLTEMSPCTHLTPDDAIRSGSIGYLVCNMVAKIVDPQTGAELGPNQPGELWLRGPNVMKGYLHPPRGEPSPIDLQGFFHTGDIGYVDPDGYFFIVDRLKELIKYKGLQVPPAELEALLLTHPAVADAAVVPSPDEEAGEVPKAFVVLKGQATPDAIMAFVAESVAPHKKIRLIEVVDQIPRSASGKILRRVLVERERARVKAENRL